MRVIGTFLFAVIAMAAIHGSLTAAEKTSELKAPSETIEKWRDMRFGMFIHWGPVSLKGTEIGWSRGAPIPIEEYDNLYKKFNPEKFDADEWVKIAKDAGMKYMVLTTKHHDGFCMFDTKQTEYNIMNSPFGRDVTKELAEACRRRDVKFGAYYSVCDWRNPNFTFTSPHGKKRNPNPNMDRYEEYLTKQVEELLRNYGPLLTVWFDYPQDFGDVRGSRVVKKLRDIQPDIMVNNRSGSPRSADYATPEKRIGKTSSKPWETCTTICNQWVWKPDDKMKSLKECLHTLVKVVGGDGNLLLNVSPMPDGRIEPRQAERLREMGEWLEKYGESIHGTRGGPFERGDWGAATRKGNTVYLHILNPNLDVVKLPPIKRKIVSSSVLTGGTATVKQTGAGIKVLVPKPDRQEIDTIVVLNLDGPAADAMK